LGELDMASKEDLQEWVFEAVNEKGSATLVEVAKHIWKNHETDLKNSGDLFYTWQYDMRWAAQALRDTGKFKHAKACPRGIWIVTH
jgi:hypothetical protein